MNMKAPGNELVFELDLKETQNRTKKGRYEQDYVLLPKKYSFFRYTTVFFDFIYLEINNFMDKMWFIRVFLLEYKISSKVLLFLQTNQIFL